jgi:hypothetical protein
MPDLYPLGPPRSILSVFPTEILLDIISFLPDKTDLFALSQTCSDF